MTGVTEGYFSGFAVLLFVVAFCPAVDAVPYDADFPPLKSGMMGGDVKEKTIN